MFAAALFHLLFREKYGPISLDTLAIYVLPMCYNANMMSDDVIAEAVIRALSPCPGFNIFNNPLAAVPAFRCDSPSAAGCRFFITENDCPCVCHNAHGDLYVK